MSIYDHFDDESVEEFFKALDEPLPVDIQMAIDLIIDLSRPVLLKLREQGKSRITFCDLKNTPVLSFTIDKLDRYWFIDEFNKKEGSLDQITDYMNPNRLTEFVKIIRTNKFIATNH